MTYFTASNPDTDEDKRLYTRARLTEVSCQDCLARVGVKKNSEHHTSIQWTQQALSDCQEFVRLSTSADGRALHQSCPRLRESIEQAVREGDIEIGAEDGY